MFATTSYFPMLIFNVILKTARFLCWQNAVNKSQPGQVAHTVHGCSAVNKGLAACGKGLASRLPANYQYQISSGVHGYRLVN